MGKCRLSDYGEDGLLCEVHGLAGAFDFCYTAKAELKSVLERIVRHATDEKSPETAPPRNRLQNIVCLAEAALRDFD